MKENDKLKPYSSKADVVIDYFTNLIQTGKQSVKPADGKQSINRRSLTVETINRYIFCLNRIIEKGNTSTVDLRNEVKNELEKDKGFEIDKKTLKRIIDNLKQDKLIKTVDFEVTIEQASGQGIQKMIKTLVLDPDYNSSDEQLYQNPAINNPTNIKEHPQVKSEPRKYILRERKSKVKYEEDLASDLSDASVD